MAHYFTREEAEALLPAITLILQRIQDEREKMHAIEEELEVLQTPINGKRPSPSGSYSTSAS